MIGMKTVKLLQISYLLRECWGAAIVEPNRNGLLLTTVYVESSCGFSIDVEINKPDSISCMQLWNIQMWSDAQILFLFNNLSQFETM